MKKTLFFVLIFLVSLSCINISLYSKNKELKIAMILWRGETDAEKGFKKGLEEFGYEVKYSTFNAGQNKNKLVEILKTDLESGINDFDYIYSFGTTATLAVKLQIQNRIPHIFNIVSAPVKAGIVKSIEIPGANISGISNDISLKVQIKTAMKVVAFKKIGFFYNPKEKNSEIIYSKLKNISKDFNFKVVELQCFPESKHLENKLQKIIGKSIIIDAVYLPMDSYVISNSQLIGKQLRIAKIMSFGAQKKYIKNGALLGTVPDYFQLGEMASIIVDRHQKGEKLKNISIQTIKNPQLLINEKTRKLLNLNIPEGLLKDAVIFEK